MRPQSQVASEEGQGSLKYLTTFLTLQKAQQKGFKPEKYNLSIDQAGQIATVFSRYDANDDMMLEQREVEDLLCAPALLSCMHSSALLCITGTVQPSGCSCYSLHAMVVWRSQRN